jgi:hypothetical protein
LKSSSLSIEDKKGWIGRRGDEGKSLKSKKEEVN